MPMKGLAIFGMCAIPLRGIWYAMPMFTLASMAASFSCFSFSWAITLSNSAWAPFNLETVAGKEIKVCTYGLVEHWHKVSGSEKKIYRVEFTIKTDEILYSAKFSRIKIFVNSDFWRFRWNIFANLLHVHTAHRMSKIFVEIFSQTLENSWNSRN